MSTKLDVLDLDFDEIKQSVIEFLETNPEFADYDFTGSAMNILIDALAYTIHYTGVYANFSLNESFLDTAIRRKSVVSKAKEIGYTPTQSTGAKAEFRLTFDHIPINNTSGNVVFPRGQKFIAATIDNTALPFVMVDDNYFYEDTANVYTGIAQVVQGQFIQKNWTAGNDIRYTIDQDGVSTNHMIVKVNGVRWNASETLVQVSPASEVYYISELCEGQIEIYFGNDILGKAVADGSTIDIEYLVNNGFEGNFLSNFSVVGDVFLNDADIVFNNDIIFSEIEKSYDGSDPETIESIKFLAPLDYQRQNRVVTIDDYKTAVLSQYNNVQAINAWGGEDNDPPEYGKVFLSVKPKTGEKVSATTKVDIETNILTKFGVVGIVPEIVDPDYLAVDLNTIVYYNKDQTILNTNQLISTINETIKNFFFDSVFDYEASFKYSNLMTEIDNSEDSIVSNETAITISKYFLPKTVGSSTYYISYKNEITPDTIESIYWTNTANSQSQLKDDGKGKVDLYVNDTIFKRGVGIVDYEEGKLSLLSFSAEPLTDDIRIYIKAKPVNLNVAVAQNNIIILGTVGVSVEPITK